MDNSLDFLMNSDRGNYYSSIPDARRIIWVNVKQEVITILHHNHEGQEEEEERKEQQEVLRITVRNSNELNIVPFPNVSAVFDMNTFDSTKRHQHRISGGALGDALKEILAMPYALISGTDDGSTFTCKQWETPLILRFSREEYRVYLRVNKADDKSPISTHVYGPYQLRDSSSSNNNDDYYYVEVEVTIPVFPAILGSRECLVKNLEQFYKKYILFRTKEVEFHFNESEGKNPTTKTAGAEGDKSE